MPALCLRDLTRRYGAMVQWTWLSGWNACPAGIVWTIFT